MQSSQADDNVDSNTKCENVRKRKRLFFNRIREQMEFYFSDANLSKDRFLMQLIKEDSFVALDIFLSFNKIKVLVNSIEDIVKSLSNSKLLILNEDKTKVRRSAPLLENFDSDLRTIYVEGLPPTADHDSVTKVFTHMSGGGKVVYVSLPKYKKSQNLKEFGFVEFDSELAVKKCLKSFNSFNGVLNVNNFDPSCLKSVKSFLKEQNEENTANIKIDDKIQDESLPKRSKLEEQEVDNTKPISNANLNEIVICEASSTHQQTNKKKRKRKRKTFEQKQSLNMELNLNQLKIISKKNWKRLRNKYLNSQRDIASELKRKMFEKNFNCQKNNSKQVKNKTLSSSLIQPQSLQKFEIIKSPHYMNFYRANKDIDDVAEKDTKLFTGNNNTNKSNSIINESFNRIEKPPLFNFEPGVIVNIVFHQPCIDCKSFKSDIKQYDFVKYVDVKEAALEAYVRCESNQAAQQLCKQIQSAEYVCKLLTEQSERVYWSKIMSDREMKLNKTVKTKVQRGREKMKKITKKHIRFEDDDSDDKVFS